MTHCVRQSESFFVAESPHRRQWLLATAGLGGVLTLAAIAPFVGSLLPSDRAKAAGAPVEVDIDKLAPSEMMVIEWRGKPVWILRRTPEMLATLKNLESKLVDPRSQEPQQPQYANNEHRSLKPEYLVAVGICTHLGCSPTFRPEVAPADLGGDWLGGFFCPCHQSKFDLAGRVYAGVPAPTNLVIPPYRFVGDTKVVIGDDGKSA